MRLCGVRPLKVAACYLAAHLGCMDSKCSQSHRTMILNDSVFESERQILDAYSNQQKRRQDMVVNIWRVY